METTEYVIIYWVHGDSNIELTIKNRYERSRIKNLLLESGATCVNWTKSCLIITTKHNNIENIKHLFWLIRMGYYGSRWSDYLNNKELSYNPVIMERFAEDGSCSFCGKVK